MRNFESHSFDQVWPGMASHIEDYLDLSYVLLVGFKSMSRLKIVRNERLIDFEGNKDDPQFFQHMVSR